MASQPSAHNEERNLLRLRAWEQRTQETSQTTELNSESVPLFGEPYKTNKGDELSNRIKRMLGSYENVNNPSPFPMEALPIPSYATFSLSDPSQPGSDKSTKSRFHNQVVRMSSESPIEPPRNGFSSQPAKMSTTSPSPNPHGHSSTFPNPSLSHSQGGHSPHQHKASSDLRERDGFPQEMSAQCPDVKPPPFLHSSDHRNTDMDTKDTFDRHRRRGSTGHPESAIPMEVSTLNIKQSPKDVALSQANRNNALPSHTFPPLLSSKQPSIVMTQKPTAYVRPTIDGQDQVISESPELKLSPEPYVTDADFSKSDQGNKNTIKPQISESRTDEAQCVEDILMEMTHSWPPLLTAIHTPNAEEPSKFLFPAKEAERVSSCPGQNNHNSLPAQSSHHSRQSFSNSFQAAHSSGGEFASSSDSDSSSGSESDSEGTTEDPPRGSICSSVKTKTDTPAQSHVDWQLGNWIPASQQSSSSKGQGGAHVPESATRKQLPPAHSSKHCGGEVADPSREPVVTPPLSSCQKESSVTLTIPQQRSETSQEKRSLQKSLPADVNGLNSSKKLSKPAKAGRPDGKDRAVSVKSVVTTQTKDLRPKVKTKTEDGKKNKDKSDSKREAKRTKETSRVASEPPEVQPSLSNHCSSCKGCYPDLCSCPNPTQPDQKFPATPAVHKKTKAESVCQRGTKTSHETTQKHAEKPGKKAKDSQELHRPPRSLLVKIDLSLLPPASTHQGIPSKAKTSTAVRERDGGGSGEASKTQKRTKSSKKNKPQNVDVESKTVPRKKLKLENNNTSTTVSTQLESSSNLPETQEKKKAKKNAQQPATFNDTTKDSKLHKNSSGKSQEISRDAQKSKDSSKQRKNSGKHLEHPHSEKQKPTKRSLAVPPPSQPIREPLTNLPLLRFEERPYPAKHYIKEAKRLKHKADAESDKTSKAFNYLDAAMFFVESGIAMGKDPQISMSSYTMFADTVELLKFVLRNQVVPSSSPSEKDFLALCLKCQSLLQLAMFHYKQKTALKYSKTLTDHFNNSAQAIQNPPPIASKIGEQSSASVPSPANTPASSSSSGGGAAAAVAAAVGASVSLPPAMVQVALNYVKITTLVLGAHDLWEQAEELQHRGSGLLGELDSVLGALSLSSSMSFMVRYTRQGVHWLRMNSLKV